MRVKLMATTTGVALFLIVGALTAIYSQQAFAKDPTSLSLEASPNKGKAGSAGTLHVSLSGVAIAELEGVHGVGRVLCGVCMNEATIHIKGIGEGKELTVTANEDGDFGTSVDLTPGTHEIQAYFPGNDNFTSSSATRVVTVTS